MKRPSHFMLMFLIVIGTALFVWRDQLGPTPMKPSIKPAIGEPQLLNRGRGAPVGEPGAGGLGAGGLGAGGLGAPGAQGAGLGSGATSSPAKAREAAGPVAGAGPWTLFGKISREGTVAAPAEAVQVGLELIPLGDGRHTASGMRSAISAADGNFSWAGLYPGAYRVRALPDPDTTSHLPIAVDVNLPRAEPPEQGFQRDEQRFQQDLVLPLPRTLHGTLVTRNRAPRSGLKVSVSETGMHRGTAVSDGSGAFLISGVGAGPFEIQVRTDDGKAVPVERVERGRASSEQQTVEVAVLVP